MDSLINSVIDHTLVTLLEVKTEVEVLVFIKRMLDVFTRWEKMVEERLIINV